jgi:hypothetical protein
MKKPGKPMTVGAALVIALIFAIFATGFIMLIAWLCGAYFEQ